MPNPSASSLKRAYRPDIDGLRAIAVILIIGFHARVPGFGNGFAGVDIFFVISGFLISGIVFDGLERGDFSFRDFYVRRINRILPALLVVVAAVALAGWLFLYGEELESLGRQIVGASTFSNNFVLWRETGYFAAKEKPLLHLWSLAVEEQFYLLWPVTVVAVWGVRRRLIWVLAGIIAVSFAMSVWLAAAGHGRADFYLPFGRFWEILAGGLVRMAATDRAQGSGNNGRIALGISAAGAAMLGLTVVTRIPEGQWPGWRALLPVVGTSLLIAGGPTSWIQRNVLSRKGLVGIGLISYPLYLWHWPILAFARIIEEGGVQMRWRAALVAIAFVLAFATFRLVEIPIRFGAQKRRSASRLLIGLPVIFAIGAAFHSGIFGARLDKWMGARIARWGPDWYKLDDQIVDNGKGVLTFSRPGDSTRTVFLYGDSHIQQYWPRVVTLSLASSAVFPKVTILAYGGCPPLPGVNRRGFDWSGRVWMCDALNRAAFDAAMKPDVKTVVFGALWEWMPAHPGLYPANDLESERLRAGDPRAMIVFQNFEKQIGALLAAGKAVYIILSNPTVRSHIPGSDLPKRLSGLTGSSAIPVISKQEFLADTRWVSGVLQGIAQRTGARVIDPADYLCGDTNCRTMTAEGMPMYRDADHLRAGYVRDSVTWIDGIFHR
jgi:peptidoglycan/LPS O-acetylase OafA/YrhL